MLRARRSRLRTHLTTPLVARMVQVFLKRWTRGNSNPPARPVGPDRSHAPGVRRELRMEIGGREGIRTPGLLVANEALSQLSYSPTSSKSILANAPVLANTRSSAHKHIGEPAEAGSPNSQIVVVVLPAAVRVARWFRPRAGLRSSWHSDTARAPAESLPRLSALADRLPVRP